MKKKISVTVSVDVPTGLAFLLSPVLLNALIAALIAEHGSKFNAIPGVTLNSVTVAGVAEG